MDRTRSLGLGLLIAAPSLAIQVNVQFVPATCSQCNGAAQAFVTGGAPPYSYLWTPNPANGQGTNQIWGLCPGQWSVLVTDAVGATATADLIIDALPGLSPFLQAQQLLSDCENGCNGWAVAYESTFGGTPPYNYSWGMTDTGLMGPGSVTFQGLCTGTTPISVVDAQGCTGLIQATVGMESISTPSVGALPACGTGANGAIIASGPGDNPVFRVQGGSGFDSLYVLSGFPPFTLGGVPAGEYSVSPMGWAPWGGGYLDLWCTAPAMVTVPALPQPCGTLTGLIYHDADQDCALNNFDIRLPYRVLSIEPGGVFTISDANGQFARNLSNGSYTLAQGALTDEVPFCPASGSTAFTISTTTPTAYVEFANLSTAPHDVSVQLTSSAARPGFATQVWVTVSNNSAFPSGDVTVDLDFDPLLLNPSPTQPWNIGVIAPYQSVTLSFTANLPPDAGLVGSVLTYTAMAGNTAGEPDLVNNSATLDVTITASYDPNDKVGTADASGSTTQYFLSEDEWIDYVIRFQNTGTDTAFTVVLRDSLPAELDPLSLRIVGASHAFIPSFGAGRELVFTFNDILLPDSTTDLLGSQGFVAFRLHPVAGLMPGTTIGNIANIYFDFNPPVITEPSVLVAEFSTEVEGNGITPVQVWPIPADDQLHIRASASIATLRVIASDGREVNVPASAALSSLDVSCLQAGAYLLIVGYEGGTESRQRFIIQE